MYRTAKSDRCDRLSELHDSLILVILSLLEMKDAVRTTILSKRWKDVWTTVPCLDFCCENRSFINRALAKWKGTKILKFCLRFGEYYPAPTQFRDSWLLFPIEKQVEELYLYLGPFMDYEYCAPQPLNSCSSITKLCLSYCNLKNMNVQWNQLKSLVIEHPSNLSEDAMNRILSGAPLLEELNLLSLEISKNLSIESTSLKMLKIHISISRIPVLVENAPLLNIGAPNLESLEISGAWNKRCLLNVPSLTNAILGFEDYKPSCYILREEMFRQAFLSLSHVQKLTLNYWLSVKFLVEEMKKENFVLFPKLEILIFEDDERSYNCYSLAPNTIFPGLSLSLLQLKTVVITWDVCDASIFVVVEILLENARGLEKMVIRLRKHKAYPDKYILALEKVVSMQRASPYVEVIISKV